MSTSSRDMRYGRRGGRIVDASPPRPTPTCETHGTVLRRQTADGPFTCPTCAAAEAPTLFDGVAS